jgi:hypothetical protein
MQLLLGDKIRKIRPQKDLNDQSKFNAISSYSPGYLIYISRQSILSNNILFVELSVIDHAACCMLSVNHCFESTRETWSLTEQGEQPVAQ